MRPGEKGKKRTKGACGLGRPRAPFFCLQFRAAARAGFAKACKAACSIEQKPAAGNRTGKKCRTRRVAEMRETGPEACCFYALGIVVK